MVSATQVDGLVRQAAASSVASLFLMRARLHPERWALVEGDRRLSYGDLARRAVALADWLQGHGVGQGDRVAILSENRLEYLELFLAAAWIGAIVACQNWRLAAPELATASRWWSPRPPSCRRATPAALPGVRLC